MPSNPIITGFAPDPSVTRIGNTFYLVTSSFHLFPGLPIYASTDLLSWKLIGNAINRSTQLSLIKSGTSLITPDTGAAEKAPATGGLYAPTIRHRNGVTFIVCTNVIHHFNDDHSFKAKEVRFENFVISTSDIALGHWSDPIYFDFHGIDPDLFFDDDGRAYVSGSSWQTIPSTINCFEINLQTGRKLSDERVIWTGHSKVIPEGPHIYKRGGHYYLLDAEGGTHEGHCISIARSQSIWGPYESCPDNPILKPSNDLTQPFAESGYHGHGDLIQDKDGSWWLVCLGVRRDRMGRMILGRETFLTAVYWPSSQLWPIITQPITRNLAKISPFENTEKSASPIPSAHSTETAPSRLQPDSDMVWIRDGGANRTRFTQGGNVISLLRSENDLDECTHLPVSFVGRRQRQFHGSARVSTFLDSSSHSAENKFKAGLVYYKDEHRFARICSDSVSSSIVFEVINRAKSPPVSRRDIVRRYAVSDGMNREISFRIVHTDMSIQFSYRMCGGEGDETWHCGGQIDTLDLSGPDFTGPVIGIFATGLGNDYCTFEDVFI
ncbi:glycosyl hydrolase [Aspergillus heterothallicus]